MGRIETSKKLVVGHVWKTRQIRIFLEELKWNVRKTHQWPRSLVDDTPRFGSAEVPADVLESMVMLSVRGARESGHEANGIADVKACNHIGVDQFAQHIAIRETLEFGQRLRFRGLL